MITETYRTIDTAQIESTCYNALRARGLVQGDRERGFTTQLTSVNGSRSSQHRVRITLHGLAQVVHGDLITPQLLFFNSYKGESAFTIAVGFLRAICTNGMILGDAGYHERIVHRAGDTCERKLAEMADKIGAALDYVVDGGLRSLTQSLLQPLTQDEMYWIAARLPQLSNRMKDRVLYAIANPHRVEDAGENVWALWNIANEVIRQGTRSPYRQDVRNLGLLSDIQYLADTDQGDAPGALLREVV